MGAVFIKTEKIGRDKMNFKQEILKSIQIMIEQKLNSYKSDRTFISVIKQKNLNGTYVILDDTGSERTVKCCIPNADLKVRQKVWVKIPMNDLKKIHICGVA